MEEKHNAKIRTSDVAMEGACRRRIIEVGVNVRHLKQRFPAADRKLTLPIGGVFELVHAVIFEPFDEENLRL